MSKSLPIGLMKFHKWLEGLEAWTLGCFEAGSQGTDGHHTPLEIIAFQLYRLLASKLSSLPAFRR
jgi:hypothetical protein